MGQTKTINLNDPSDFTLDNVRLMIAGADDGRRNQIRVTRDGVAFVSEGPLVGCRQIKDLAFRLV
jgi:hypothetical protein